MLRADPRTRVLPSQSFLENCRELNAIKFTICAPAITQLAEVKGDVPGRYPRRLPSGSVITGEASNCGLAPISSPVSRWTTREFIGRIDHGANDVPNRVNFR